jgi:hypothetical protein
MSTVRSSDGTAIAYERRGHGPTLVASGGAADFYESAADAVAAALPNGRRLTLEAQGHVVDPKAMADALFRFFA